MVSLETTRTAWQARADPRRRTASIAVYTHVRDRWGIFYDQSIVLNERQAGVAIEGVIPQSNTDDVILLAVDTHGFVVTRTCQPADVFDRFPVFTEVNVPGADPPSMVGMRPVA